MQATAADRIFLDIITAAGDDGIDSRELREAAGGGMDRLHKRTTRLRQMQMIVKAPLHGNHPARWYAASHAEAAALYVYPPQQPSNLAAASAGVKRAHDARRERRLDVIRRAGRAGIMRADLIAQTGMTEVAADGFLNSVSDKIVRVSVGRLRRYHMVEFAPAPADKTLAIRSTRVMLDPSAPAIVPPGVKWTRCPGGLDTRYTPDPAIAGRGVISEDWMERRQYGS